PGAACTGTRIHGVRTRGARTRGARIHGAPWPGVEGRHDMTTLPRSVKLLIAGAAVLGIGCLAIRVPEITRWDVQDLIAVAMIAALTIAAERYSIPLRRGTETVNFALTDGVWAG